MSSLAIYNRPIIPPGTFIGGFLVVGLVLFLVSRKIYAYTYNTGYLLPLLLFVDSLFVYYSLYFIGTRYLGEYYPISPNLPIILVIVSLVLNNVVLTLCYDFVVLRGIYLVDERYKEWKSCCPPNPIYWWLFILLLMPLFGGHRLHKLNYSKLFRKDIFSFRITAVSKFY